MRSPRPVLPSLVFALLAAAAASRADPAAPAEPDRLLPFLIEQNEAARAKIHSCSYSIDQQSQDFRRGGMSVGAGEIKRRGDWLWSVYRQPATNRTTGQMTDREMRLVVNDHYSALWPMKGNPIAYWSDHRSIAEMDPNVRARNQVNTPEDFSRHCFGDARDSFRIAAAQFPELKWDAAPRKADDGYRFYEIRRYIPGANEIPRADCVWTIDADQGYLATSVVAQKPDGTPWLQYRISAIEAAPGVWFPVEFEEKRFGEPADAGRNEVSLLKKIKLTNVRVNDDLPDAQFQIGALRLKEDFPTIVVLRRTLEGKNVPYVYAGDQLVEQDARRKPIADAPAKSK